MKKNLSLLLAAVLILGLCGCSQPEPPPEVETTVIVPTGATEPTAPPETTAPQSELPKATEASRTTEPTDATEPTDPPQREEAKETHSEQREETKPTEPPATEETQPTTKPTDPPPTQPSETEPPETKPPKTEDKETPPPTTVPPETEPVETEPPATEEPTQPTEPPRCQHDWMCIHHAEEGHWRAGIACDCGWTVYGEPDELVTLWIAHSASYPPTESLFDHGGYGSMDEWIVDKPAYDEWVCRHCGEPKP